MKSAGSADINELSVALRTLLKSIQLIFYITFILTDQKYVKQ